MPELIERQVSKLSQWHAAAIRRLMPKSLHGRLVLMVCMATLFGSVTIGAISYVRLKQIAVDNAVEGFAAEARLVAAGVEESYRLLGGDASLLSRTPSVRGLVRAVESGGIDSLSGLATEQLRQRMQAIFSDLLQLRPAYTQARLIGIADGGRELVRVNRHDDGLEVVPSGDLQQKEDEPYFKAASTLAAGTIYYSDVTYNREHGQIVFPRIPTIRAVVPVEDETHRQIGMIVINVDYDAMLSDALERARTTREVTVFNAAGDYMIKRPGKAPDPLEFHEDYTRTPPPVLARPRDQSEKVTVEGRNLSYFVGLGRTAADPVYGFGVALKVPVAQLLVPAYAMLRETIIVGLFLIAVTLLLGYLAGARLTRPLRLMTRNIRRADANTERLDLPVDGQDEIGELARAFTQLYSDREVLIERLTLSNRELEEFAYVAAHDLKAPLRVVDNASRWVAEDLGDDLPGEVSENLQLMRGRVTRMERLLDDLLDYGRIGRQDDERYHEVMGGDELVGDVQALVAVPDNFRIVVSPDLSRVRVNRMPLQQILLNLISNSIKHHDKPNGTIRIGVTDEGDRFAFTVADDGPGIPKDYQQLVFKMFQTLKPRDQVEGSGMGLAVVKKQVELFGGTITLQSQEGAGTTMRFTWPKRQQRRSDGPEPARRL